MDNLAINPLAYKKIEFLAKVGFIRRYLGALVGEENDWVTSTCNRGIFYPMRLSGSTLVLVYNDGSHTPAWDGNIPHDFNLLWIDTILAEMDREPQRQPTSQEKV